jgi:signal transduction histidine kinase/CheY-like chemotaxis protein
MNDFSNIGDGKTISILVVDDDPQVTFVISDFLETAHFNVITCNCGADALKVIETREVDLVLLDIIMPDIDGFIVAKKMKSFFGKDDFVPIIMLTGLTGIDERIAGLEYADDIVSKPFSHKELLARINVMLRIRSLQRELVASRSQYRFLYENVPFMYVSVNEERIVRNCNAQFGLKNGAPKEAIIGKNIELFFTKADHSALGKFIQSIHTHSIANNPVMTLVPLNPALSPLSVSVSGVHMGERNPGYSVEMVLQDITQMLKLQQEQRDARKQLYLSARLASIGTLASGVAHELNNPLTAILGFSSALLERMRGNDKFDKDEFTQYLAIINSETLRCRDIIENLSKFARETEAQIVPFRLKECVLGAVKLIMPRANKKDITIVSDIPEAILAKADPQKLEQVLIHVINNCIDFCKEGSAVTITVESKPRFVKLSVADNGPGIASDIVPKVFDPFFTTKKVGQGAGLGLAISHHIMEECNGSIDISSEIGKGTNITLEIPSH